MRTNNDDVDNPFAWLNAGIRLVIDCFKALFKFRKPKDETWNEFIMVKIGSLLLIGFGLLLIVGAVTLFYAKIHM